MLQVLQRDHQLAEGAAKFGELQVLAPLWQAPPEHACRPQGPGCLCCLGAVQCKLAEHCCHAGCVWGQPGAAGGAGRRAGALRRRGRGRGCGLGAHAAARSGAGGCPGRCAPQCPGALRCPCAYTPSHGLVLPTPFYVFQDQRNPCGEQPGCLAAICRHASACNSVVCESRGAGRARVCRRGGRRTGRALPSAAWAHEGGATGGGRTAGCS